MSATSCLELQISLSSTDCRLVTILTELDRGYLTKRCTLLARLFCLLEEDLSTTGGGVDCTLTLIVSSTDRLAAMMTDLYRDSLMKNSTPLARLFTI